MFTYTHTHKMLGGTLFTHKMLGGTHAFKHLSYLCILCQIIQRCDSQIESASLCEVPEADATGAHSIFLDAIAMVHQFHTV